MGLPESCDKCQSFGGNFQFISGGLTRCDCARGRSLRDMDEARRQLPVRDVEPQISDETATTCISMLSAMRWFPTEPAARMLIAKELQSMCNEDSEAVWLVRRVARLFESWPGIPALRQVFCKTYIPLDRVRPVGICEAYPDGIPAEIEAPPDTPQLTLPAGSPAVDVIKYLVEAMPVMPQPSTCRERSAEPPINPNFKPITQADIDKAVRELRDRKAREELGDGSSTD